ncbi:MAG: DUF2249 domain-containing protein [Candidatus Rokubacteria bacterium]|nr:DUF2249 domain-containing protein [Candidatus Rokubacteria bacterium]
MADRPQALRRITETNEVRLDVREDIRRGRDPFARIMATVKALAPEQALVLRVPFEPVPLLAVLGKRGFAHWAEQSAPDDWTVWFYREPSAPAEAVAGARATASADGDMVVLDVRGLEPPEPLVQILDRLDSVRPGQRLVVLHERRPMLLYPQLDERGFLHDTEEIEPGLVRIVIHRPAPPS